MAGRPVVITGPKERQLEALIRSGVSQTLAAEVLGISRRTVCRWAAQRRRDQVPPEPPTTEQLLAALPETLDDLLRDELVAPAFRRP